MAANGDSLETNYKTNLFTIKVCINYETDN